jgi:hypothetical protein
MADDPNEARRKAYYEADFKPANAGGGSISPELRIASAVEYIAYQLGQISRKIDNLTTK